MAKDKPEKKPPKDKPRRGRIAARAARDVGLEQQPVIDQLERAMAAAQSAYGGYEDLLSPMQSQYNTQTQDIAGDLMSQYEALSAMLGGNIPASEFGAATEAFGGAGAGALGILASDAQRNLDFGQSAQREGGLSSRYAQDNLIQQMNELYAQRPEMVRQRTDELRDQRLEQQLVQSQIASDEAFNQYLQGQIGAALDPPRNNNKPPRDEDKPNTNPGPRNVPGTPPYGGPPTGIPPYAREPEDWLAAIGGNVQAPGDPYTEFIQGMTSWKDLAPKQRQDVRQGFRQYDINPKVGRRRVRKYYA